MAGPFHLTSPVTLWAGVIVSIVVLLVGLVLVPMLVRRTRVWGLVVQAGVLVMLPVLVLLTVFVGVNRATRMFEDWGEVFAAGDVGGQAATDVGGAGHAPAAPKPAATGAVTALQAHPLTNPALAGIRDMTGGQWVTTRVRGAASKVEEKVAIHFPAGYLQHPERRYPVLFAFEGIPGSLDVFKEPFALGESMDSMAASKKMREAIVVAPDVYPGTNDTECVDQSRGPNQMDTWVSKDLVGWAHTNLRTFGPGRGGLATFGYSAGGFCASMFSVKHPELFPTSVSMAGCFAPWFAPGKPMRPAGDRTYDLPTVVRATKPAVRMYFFSGGEDQYSLDAGKSMKRAVKDAAGPTSFHEVLTPKGGHNVLLFAARTPQALQWLAENDPSFAPAK